METDRSECMVKEKKRKKLLSCSFRRLGMCFRNNVRESAFKFLQFTTYNIISRYTSLPIKKRCYFHSHLISSLCCSHIKSRFCVCVWMMAPIWFVPLLHCCLLIDFPLHTAAKSVRKRILAKLESLFIEVIGHGEVFFQIFPSSLPNVFTFFSLSCGFFVKGMSRSLICLTNF